VEYRVHPHGWKESKTKTTKCQKKLRMSSLPLYNQVDFFFKLVDDGFGPQKQRYLVKIHELMKSGITGKSST